MGHTDGGNAPLFRVAGEGEAERADGCRSGDGMVAGTYLHGLFEHVPVRQALIGWLGARRGLPLEAGMAPSREVEYNRLAAAVRDALDLAAVYRLLKQRG
jgi:adenosylcobyric acid synthase